MAQQVWGKPLPGGAWAVLAINGETNREFDVTVPFSLFNATAAGIADNAAAFNVTDVWTGDQLPAGSATGGNFTIPAVAPRGCGFYELTPI